ncbi:transglycosylase SLT domain-containing protein [Ramlibacter tataouinensis]|uniref:lytic transglycosylase domain-containing protein n=1 Tax=Ramlibacter tataouinensis TaxID=94132 RepID=UPI0022F3B0A8|nr:lytic transglycosylase domain-containing protein [Ramlibacter tataouinensis]WBY03614.1 transglycosylase SLT domain-containing protein [Ramlibacter tataouinensis]
MKFRPILTSLLLAMAGAALAQTPGDDTVLEMAQAWRKGDKVRLAQLLPQVRGHALEPWAAYWELRARLDTATPAEVQDFLVRYAGTYQEDRLRNDWLRLLGERRDWASFADLHAHYRMQDDPQVKCYALLVQHLSEGPAAPATLGDEVRRLWFAQRNDDDACSHAASRLMGEAGGRNRLVQADAWRKARLAIEANRPRAAAAAVEMVAPEALPLLAQIEASPTRFLAARVSAASRVRKELIGLALLKLATGDIDNAARLLEDKWGPQISPEERNWIWGTIAKQSAQRQSPDALGYYARVSRDSDLSDDMLAWKARAALRAGNRPLWDSVRTAIDAMSDAAQQDPAWQYWKARALLASGREAQRAQAARMLEALASPRGFYEQLALEELGRPVTVPAPPAPLTPEEREAARLNPALNRALYAILIGLRPEGNREWVYATALARPGGMGERELLAAAQMACEREVWDRCINTSERTREAFDAQQRFPMPHRDAVVRRSQAIGLDPAYVYGLIRQESRFIMDARSHVGASGLMQVMPATARWTARKIGLNGFRPEQLTDRETNITIGTAYLKLALDDLDGSMPLAAAAYNAGPRRPRAWRNGPVMEAAAWAEGIPFGETRDYVKKVLANTTLYAAILTGQPQSLKARLGLVGPRDAALPEPMPDLP